jgi:hypothetical protein
MFVKSIFLSSYAEDRLISGAVDIATSQGEVRIEFTDAECEAIQAVVERAYARKQQALAREILENTPAVKALAPPEHIEEATYTEF